MSMATDTVAKGWIHIPKIVTCLTTVSQSPQLSDTGSFSKAGRQRRELTQERLQQSALCTHRTGTPCSLQSLLPSPLFLLLSLHSHLSHPLNGIPSSPAGLQFPSRKVESSLINHTLPPGKKSLVKTTCIRLLSSLRNNHFLESPLLFACPYKQMPK